MDKATTLITCLSGVLVGLLPFLINTVRALRERRELRARRRLYGVIGNKYPELLKQKHYVEFTDPLKFERSGLDVGVLLCRNLSFALRYCDFVFAQEGFDPKIIDCDDDEQIRCILD